MSTSFFVAADWLAEHIDDPEIQIIDARMAPAGQEALRDMAADTAPAMCRTRCFSISRRYPTTPVRCRI